MITSMEELALVVEETDAAEADRVLTGGGQESVK